MQIWLLSSELPWVEAGGIGSYCFNFATALGAAGHEVTWIGFSNRSDERQLAPGVRVIELQPRSQHLPGRMSASKSNELASYPDDTLPEPFAGSYQMAEEVLRLLRSGPCPDVIESQDYFGLPYYLLQRKLVERTALDRIPIVVHLHGPSFEIKPFNHQPRYRFPDYWVGQTEKFSIIAADALLSPSRFLADSIRRTLCRELDITCFPLPVNTTHGAGRQEVSPGEIVYFGRLELRKGVLSLVKACSRMWANGDDFRLKLIGGNTAFVPRNTTVGAYLRARYAAWIKSGHLVLTGDLSQRDAHAQISRAWAVVVPSLWENFPNTCIEAMAAGQLVLASRSGGQAEMIEADGVNGLLFDWDVPGDCERQLQRALSLHPDERRVIGENARRRILAYCDPRSVVEQRVAHYQRVIERHAPRRIFPSVNQALEESKLTIHEGSGGEKKLLSVIIPFYNLGEYLGEAVQSVLASSYAPLEIIIVNDGSTDAASLKVLHEIEQQQADQVRVMHTDNQGLALARNTGVAAARGEYIAFVDADDAVEKEFFQRAVDVLQQFENVAFVYSWVQFFGESHRIWPTWNTELPYLLGHNMLTAFAVVRRAWFERAGRNNPIFEYSLEDYAGWLSIVLAGGLGVSIPEPLVRYRVRQGSMSRSGNFNERLYLYERLVELYPEAYRAWGAELFNLQQANGPGALWDHPAQMRSDFQYLANYQHLGVSVGDRSFRLAAQLITRMRRNWFFRRVLRHPSVYLRLRQIAQGVMAWRNRHRS